MLSAWLVFGFFVRGGEAGRQERNIAFATSTLAHGFIKIFLIHSLNLIK